MNTDDELPAGWTPRGEAIRLLAWLRESGAIIHVKPDGFAHVDLNPIEAIQDYADADAVAKSILALRHELKALLALEHAASAGAPGIH